MKLAIGFALLSCAAIAACIDDVKPTDGSASSTSGPSSSAIASSSTSAGGASSSTGGASSSSAMGGSGGSGGVSMPMTCSNQMKDGDETDVDCGGSCAPCAFGKACKQTPDCVGGTCVEAKCNPPGRGAWTKVAVMGTSPSARAGGAMIYHPTKKVSVLFGGTDQLNDTDNHLWTWDGTTWTELMPAGAPTARAYFAFTYHATADRVVLFGGLLNMGAVVLGETWTLDVSAVKWTKLNVAAPTLRWVPCSAYDPLKQWVVVSGGWDGMQFVGSTSAFDGQTWSTIDPSSAPLSMCSLEYDAASSQMLRFGGSMNAQHIGDPSTWIEKADGSWDTGSTPLLSPPRRVSAGMVYDTRRHRLILHGGSNDKGATFGDTWEWNGSTWERTLDGVFPRSSFMFAFDQNRGVAVAFGGFGANNMYAADTLEYRGFANACGSDGDCDDSYHCVDGLCCDAPSCAAGQACNVASNPGSCTATQ